MHADIPELSVRELQEAMASANPPRLIDVREPDEFERCRIPGGELIPLSQFTEIAIEKLGDKDQALLIQCHHGGRSARATAWLLGQGFTNVKNVTGGIDAWSTEIDPSVPRYD